MDPWTALAVIAIACGVVYIIGSLAALWWITKVFKDL